MTPLPKRTFTTF